MVSLAEVLAKLAKMKRDRDVVSQSLLSASMKAKLTSQIDAQVSELEKLIEVSDVAVQASIAPPGASPAGSRTGK